MNILGGLYKKMPLFQCPFEKIGKNRMLKIKGVNKLFLLPKLKKAIKFPVQQLGVGLKKKSGFCFSNLPHKIIQLEQKYVF